MSDPQPAPEPPGQAWLPVAPDGDWQQAVEQIIGWAVWRGDQVVDGLVAYLDERTRQGRPWPVHDLTPVWAGDESRRTPPVRGRGRDQSCAALRRRLRLRHGCQPRPLGTDRPPRGRRIQG